MSLIRSVVYLMVMVFNTICCFTKDLSEIDLTCLKGIKSQPCCLELLRKC